MWMQQRLGLKLTQKPILTQSLRQLVKLLALNKLDLKEEINQELLGNPALEMTEPGSGPDGETQEEESWEGAGKPDEPATAVSDGDSEGVDAVTHIAEGAETQVSAEPERAAEEPTNALDEIDLPTFFDDYVEAGSRAPIGEVIERPSFEVFLAKPVTLTDHLRWQLSLSHASEGVCEGAELVIGNLNEDGYLTATVEELIEASEVPREVMEQALELVQHFDPIGVAARDLQECLLIQLRALEADSGLAGQIVRDYRRELEDGNWTGMAGGMGRPLRHVETAVALIKNLDPRPGQRYSPTSARVVEPDMHFVRTPHGFRVALNEDDLPELRLNRRYRRLLRKGSSSKDVRNYVRERYNSAIQLLRNIEQRRQTIRTVCESIVRRQGAFLSQGLDHLRPMMIKEVAEEISVHPSTVSRAVANKYAHTPHGVYELRFFFSEAVRGPAGATIPLMLLKRKVKKMIEEEDAARPLTDDRISKILRESGISVTRRTVAKYREDMNIPSTHRRRRKNQPTPGRMSQ